MPQLAFTALLRIRSNLYKFTANWQYRRISRYRIGPKFKPRTYYVHEESRDVHSVGKVRLFFSTTKAPAQSHRVEVQKTLMTNDEKLTLVTRSSLPVAVAD